MRVAILLDGNNVQESLHSLTGDDSTMLDLDSVIPRLISGRELIFLCYLREGAQISSSLRERLMNKYHGEVFPCGKSADSPLTVKALQWAPKVDCIVLGTGDGDFTYLVNTIRHMGVRVEIAAFQHSLSRALAEIADRIHTLDESLAFSYKPDVKRPKQWKQR